MRLGFLSGAICRWFFYSVACEEFGSANKHFTEYCTVCEREKERVESQRQTGHCFFLSLFPFFYNWCGICPISILFLNGLVKEKGWLCR